MVTKRQKEAFIEYRKQGTYEEAGKEMGISAEAVYQYKSKVEDDIEEIAEIAEVDDTVKEKIV